MSTTYEHTTLGDARDRFPNVVDDRGMPDHLCLLAFDEDLGAVAVTPYTAEFLSDGLDAEQQLRRMCDEALDRLIAKYARPSLP